MRVKMSGPNEWGTANDYVRHCAAEDVAPGLRVNASAYELREQTLQRMAEREARAIMAETEPMGDDYYAGRTTMHSAVYMNARTLGHGTALAEAQGALAESLRAFLA